MPTPDEEVERGGLAAAWAGGHRGRRVIDRLLPQLRRLLSPTGEVFMVTVHENDPAGECAWKRHQRSAPPAWVLLFGGRLC